jgi:hypothetical protein
MPETPVETKTGVRRIFRRVLSWVEEGHAMSVQPPRTKQPSALDHELRLFIYRHFLREGHAPTVAGMAQGVSRPLRQVRQALARLCQTHAFVLEEKGELWRAAPFSAVATAFAAEVGKRRWWGNCIWDALGILAALKRDGRILAACACCNTDMTLQVQHSRLQEKTGVIHFAVPARHWYDDIVFT